MNEERPARVLVITDHTEPSEELLSTIAARVADGPAQFRVVIPNPATAEVHLRHPERHTKAEEAEKALRAAMPAIEAAAGGNVIGSVSVRHDPMDAVEELLYSEPIDEIIVDVKPHVLGRLTHQDLEHRLHHYELPIYRVDDHAHT